MKHSPLQPSGLLLVDKPVGPTSFDIIRRIRKQTGWRKFGHAGTLDPLASGLMLILSGSATKQATALLKLDKSYDATVHLGFTSTTGDAEGVKRHVSAVVPTTQQVSEAVKSLVGPLVQTPPAYSAIKIAGQPAYKRTRRGESVELPSRKVHIIDARLTDYTYPEVSCHFVVSSGTYIRSLAEELGERLETGGYVTALRRTSVGEYRIGSASSLDELTAERLEADLIKFGS